jgi:gluconolactonase
MTLHIEPLSQCALDAFPPAPDSPDTDSITMNSTRILPIAFALAAAIFTGCQHTQPQPLPANVKAHSGETFGSLEVNDPKFFTLVELTAPLQKLASGFDWSEGPIWFKNGGYLVFSDVPSNTVYRWKQGEGVSVFVKPSGYTGAEPRGGEPGSNGLTTDSQGRLVLCEHGDRRVGRIEKNGKHITLADKFNGKRFNSPNDLAYKSNGDLYFTDPPYGLVGNVNDPKKEIPFQGVYRLKPNGEVTLLTDQMSRPNGLAFSPDEKTLYVANSDPKRAVWMAFDVKPDGTLGAGRVFFDSTSMVGPAKKGLPDGLKVDAAGNLFATGPGGVLVFSPDGKHLGTINTGEATANVGWGDDGSVLYITADMYLCRIKTKTRGNRY